MFVDGSFLAKIHDLKLQPFEFRNVPGPQRIRVEIVLRMRMEETTLMTIEDGLLSRRIGQAKDAMFRIVFRCAYYRDTLRQHYLVAYARVQISAAQETGLGWMSVYPPTDHKLLTIDVVEECIVTFVGRVTCV